jgi:hypothetical protein
MSETELTCESCGIDGWRLDSGAIQYGCECGDSDEDEDPCATCIVCVDKYDYNNTGEMCLDHDPRDLEESDDESIWCAVCGEVDVTDLIPGTPEFLDPVGEACNSCWTDCPTDSEEDIEVTLAHDLQI